MKDYIHKEFPKTCAVDDFFGQVKRTVHGKPVSDEQIAMIVAGIRSGLKLTPKDVLLDIGCGNGALSRLLFSDCREFLGVDFSEYLIQVAKDNFERLPDYAFQLEEAGQYVEDEPRPERFTKALCYGVYPYLSPGDAQKVLLSLNQRFTSLERFFIGNLPDPERANKFYPEDVEYQELLNDRESPLGIWRSKEFMKQLADSSGWKVEFAQMPHEFYASHYRFDSILTRK